ncbi:hypothetical protein [Streptomyces soliscabiei]|uniref:hypothetical protein n=1 Tax=Streptomyces soliscabiei TaxID=588897 RepID=UPI0029AD6E14|nr:hypothetical protein [Streptomyces sp. NY05-11A]MDX2677218.1 hypothetical protein [Streptomyces sp. NY05-11A]
MGVVAMGDVRNRRLHGPALAGALMLLAKPVITQKPNRHIPVIVVMGEGRPVALDNSVQNRLRF